jgi:hypothetical protein
MQHKQPALAAAILTFGALAPAAGAATNNIVRRGVDPRRRLPHRRRRQPADRQGVSGGQAHQSRGQRDRNRRLLRRRRARDCGRDGHPPRRRRDLRGRVHVLGQWQLQDSLCRPGPSPRTSGCARRTGAPGGPGTGRNAGLTVRPPGSCHRQRQLHRAPPAPACCALRLHGRCERDPPGAAGREARCAGARARAQGPQPAGGAMPRRPGRYTLRLTARSGGQVATDSARVRVR